MKTKKEKDEIMKNHVADILSSWVHPRIFVRENINFSRDPIRQPGFIVKIIDAINENKRYDFAVANLEAIYRMCSGHDFTVTSHR